MHVSPQEYSDLLKRLGRTEPAIGPKAQLTAREVARLKHSAAVKARLAKARRNTALLLRQLRRSGVRHHKKNREKRFCKERRWRFDLSWPELFVAVEIHGMGRNGKGSHQYQGQFENDCEKAATAFALGWTVIAVTPTMIKNGKAATLIAKGLTMRTEGDYGQAR
jgi:hypothetical protein